MKNLLFMRHGKSSWELDVSDQDRPLSQRGITDAHLIGNKLFKNSIKPDFAFSSPANRALHTAMICLRNLKYPLAKFQIVADLYDFSGNQVLDFIKKTDDTRGTIMVFGHNHAFTHLVNSLGDSYIENVPTSGYVHLQFKQDTWANISQGKTIETIFPKHLK
ncbi:histidine phosphatase family protein [Maribacter litopenaei]|uniref:Histidine phosphatase family protein n=1 Tax=Maribacter litopenaei TaxID=2976127 RepID=A0ABY5Y566_9FLAO|nr:histidine phosphatase family protein [Maribacter litopenaei]UWX53961.1 histidine phosphatase family protein [Maribacter litopenaei]